eukprot:9499172-Pyramimonas_sp.AAC.1
MLPTVDTTKRGKGKDDYTENVAASSTATTTSPATPKQGPRPIPRILTSDWGGGADLGGAVLEGACL